MNDMEKSIDNLVSEAVNRIEKLAAAYKKYGFSAITVASGTLVIIFTFAVAIRTSPDNPTATLFNIGTGEEILFMMVGVLLVIFGGLNLALKNYFIHRLEILEVQVRIEGIRASSKNLETLQEATRIISEANKQLSETHRSNVKDG